MNNDPEPVNKINTVNLEDTTHSNDTHPTRPFVSNISRGPFFTRKRIRIGLAVIALILLIPVITVLAKSITNRSNTVKTVQPDPVSTQPQQTVAPTPAANTKNSAAPSTQTPSTSAPTSNKVFCGVPNMPEGVCTAITSIETAGIKNNPYVTADTSALPDNTTVVTIRNSWNMPDANSGNLNFTAKVSGIEYKGTGQLAVVQGQWKVTSYKLQ